MEFNISDKKNIAGMAQLMNSNSNHNNEILELERQIISGADLDLDQEQEHELENYKQEMERLSHSYNINEYDGGSGGDHFSNYSNVGDSGNNGNSNGGVSNSAYGNVDDYFSNSKMEDTQLNYMTMEQKKQTHVDNVLKDIDNDNTSLEIDMDRERDEDDKNALLDQIDQIRDTLEDDGVELKNVPLVNKNSSMSDIKNVYKVLSIKNDRNRYCSFAEELILAGAYGIEYVFDGKNEYMGRKPDLTGWSNTVRIKLRRCRFETSTLVREIMQDYNMGSGWRLALELIPSLFLFSRNTKLARSNDDGDDYDNAISNLNSMN